MRPAVAAARAIAVGPVAECGRCADVTNGWCAPRSTSTTMLRRPRPGSAGRCSSLVLLGQAGEVVEHPEGLIGNLDHQGRASVIDLDRDVKNPQPVFSRRARSTIVTIESTSSAIGSSTRPGADRVMAVTELTSARRRSSTLAGASCAVRVHAIGAARCQLEPPPPRPQTRLRSGHPQVAGWGRHTPHRPVQPLGGHRSPARRFPSGRTAVVLARRLCVGCKGAVHQLGVASTGRVQVPGRSSLAARVSRHRRVASGSSDVRQAAGRTGRLG